jgi:ribonuclease E
MRESLKGDRARHDMTRLSKLGLMEIARQRIKGAKMAASYNTCTACDGYGLVKNVEVAALAALRKLQTRSVKSDIGRIRVGLPPDVATWLANHKREDVLRIERRHGIQVEIVPAPHLLRHESEFEAIARPPQDSAAEEPKPTAAPRQADDGKADETRKPDTRRQTGQRKTGEARRRTSKPRTRGGKTEKTDRTEAVEAVATAVAPEDAQISPVEIGTEAAVPEKPAEPATERSEKESRAGEEKAGAESKAAEADPPDESEPGDASSTAKDADGKSRRRRRRKRRPRSSQGGRSDSPEPESKPVRSEESRLVPRGIRVDELMPAASGSAEGQKSNSRSGGPKSKARSSNGRKKRRTAGSGRG